MQAGYVNYKHRLCVKVRQSKQDALTVADCFCGVGILAGHNDALTATAVGKFYYAGGHFQHWGAEKWTGATQRQSPGADLMSDWARTWDRFLNHPNWQAGQWMSASHYGRFLRN